MTETGPAAASEQGGRPGTPPQTLLVVDDEPFILSALAAYFHHMLPGLHVVRARSAAEGLRHMADGVDVVVSDYRMPDMDGLTFLRRCARDHPGTRRLLFTANIDLHVLDQARDDDAFQAWLQKGCDPQLLLDAVQDAMAQAVPARLADAPKALRAEAPPGLEPFPTSGAAGVVPG